MLTLNIGHYFIHLYNTHQYNDGTHKHTRTEHRIYCSHIQNFRKYKDVSKNRTFLQKPMTKKSFSYQTFIYHSFTKDRISQRIKTFHKPPNHRGEMLL